MGAPRPAPCAGAPGRSRTRGELRHARSRRAGRSNAASAHATPVCAFRPRLSLARAGRERLEAFVALEQLQPVLELRDPQREIVDLGLLRDSETPDQAIGDVAALR